MRINRYFDNLGYEWPVAEQTLDENLKVTRRSFQEIVFNNEARVSFIPDITGARRLLIQHKGSITAYSSSEPFSTWEKTAGMYLFESEYRIRYNGPAIENVITGIVSVSLPNGTPAVVVSCSIDIAVKQNDTELQREGDIYLIQDSDLPLVIEPLEPIPDPLLPPDVKIYLPEKIGPTVPTFSAILGEPQEIIDTTEMDIPQRLAWHPKLGVFQDSDYLVVHEGEAFYNAKPTSVIENWRR